MYSNIYGRSSWRTRRLPFVHQSFLVKTLIWIFAITVAATHAFAQDCPPSPTVNPYIGGRVFLDYGHDGTFNSGIDQPITGVTVIAYTANSAIASATSSADGTYLITDALLLAGTSYRVEFSNFPSGHQQSFSGTNNGTSVQFVTANSCNVNLALTDPNFYCQANPKFVTSCFVEGANTGTQDVLISINYNAEPAADEDDDVVLAAHESVANQIGTTYGLAYQRHSKTLFTAAYMKRFAGFGPNEAGAIYKVNNPNDGNISGSLFVDLNALFGSDVFGADPHNFTTKTAAGDVIDGASYNAVGRRAFGDIDISQDELTLWAINLNDRSLYKIPLGSDPTNPVPPASSANVTVIPLADAGSPLPNLPSGITNAEIIPFGLKVYKDKVYIGLVTNGQENGPLHGLVYSYDPTGSTFNKELDFALDYDRGCGFGRNSTCFGSANWQKWHNANTRPAVTVDGLGEDGYPQPILADIEFDAAGNMILGLRDRFGDQEGYDVPAPDASTSGQVDLKRGDAFGDLLRAEKSGNSWTIDLADFTDPSTASGTSEPLFKTDNYGPVSGYYHEETNMGGFGVLLRQNTLVTTVMDPRTNAFSNGIDWYNLSDPELDQFKAINILTGTAGQVFGKAYGLGETEFVCDLAPIQIGNRLWKDTNANGIQDPDELGVNGVEIELYKGTSASGSPIATTTTANGGQWYFSSKSHLGAGWTGTDTDTTLLAETDYTIKVKTALQTGVLSTCTAFSIKDAAGIGAADLADSDVNPDGTIAYKTGVEGVSNHTLDIGVTECVTPVITATSAQILCQGETAGDFTMNITSGTVSSQKWYGPIANNLPTTSLGTAITGATSTTFTPSAAQLPAADGVTRYYAVVGENGSADCSDTAYVAITVKPKPNAGQDQTVCAGTGVALQGTNPTTGTWTAQVSPANPAGATLGATTAGVATVSFASTASGSFKFVYTVDGCTDTVQVTVNSKPSAGPDFTGSSTICNSVASVDLPNAANGETWTQLGNAPKAVTINATTGEVAGMDIVGTYQFILANASTDCADTVSVEVKNCLKGSIGDLVWKDANDNGIQDLPTEKGVQGIIVQLLNSDSNDALLATDTTDATGIYSFNGLDSGNYKVKIVLSSLPDTCQISPKQDVATGGGNDSNDSDFNPTTGESPVIKINTLDSGIAKDNPTVDAALITPCIKPVWNLANAPVCSPTAAVYSVSFTIANKNGNLKVNAGTLMGTNPYTVTGIPNGTNLVITDSLRANCKYDTTIVAPDCSCPQINLLTPNATACIGDTLPTLKITLLGTNTNGVSTNWFANATGGSALASGLSFKPTGLITANDTFFIELTGVTGNCIDLPRTAVAVTALNCEIDLALKKSISSKIARIGDTLTYTLKVWNEFTNAASGVEVTDSIAASVQFLNGSFTASRGGAVITGNVIKWTIGNIAAAGVPANGDTVTLTYKVKATQEGVHFNTAEISKTNEKDIDSTPGNGTGDEDDIDRQCFTVPVKLCPGEKVEVSIPTKYINMQWFKDGGTTAVATGNEILFTETGTYTFTATNNTCPAEGCCPIIIEPGDNCCPEDICIPFTIKQTKKAGKNL